jgi:uncharacterized membrane-anchored protein
LQQGSGALVFGAALGVVAVPHGFTGLLRALLFQAAFILTRPQGTTVGNFLDKLLANGGLNLGRFSALVVLAALIVGLELLPSQWAGKQSWRCGRS